MPDGSSNNVPGGTVADVAAGIAANKPSSSAVRTLGSATNEAAILLELDPVPTIERSSCAEIPTLVAPAAEATAATTWSGPVVVWLVHVDVVVLDELVHVDVLDNEVVVVVLAVVVTVAVCDEVVVVLGNVVAEVVAAGIGTVSEVTLKLELPIGPVATASMPGMALTLSVIVFTSILDTFTRDCVTVDTIAPDGGVMVAITWTEPEDNRTETCLFVNAPPPF